MRLKSWVRGMSCAALVLVMASWSVVVVFAWSAFVRSVAPPWVLVAIAMASSSVVVVFAWSMGSGVGAGVSVKSDHNTSRPSSLTGTGSLMCGSRSSAVSL